MKFKIDHDEVTDIYYIVDEQIPFGDGPMVYRAFDNLTDAERFCRLANENLDNLMK